MRLEALAQKWFPPSHCAWLSSHCEFDTESTHETTIDSCLHRKDKEKNRDEKDWADQAATALFLEKDYWQNMQNALANAINKALAG